MKKWNPEDSWYLGLLHNYPHGNSTTKIFEAGKTLIPKILAKLNGNSKDKKGTTNWFSTKPSRPSKFRSIEKTYDLCIHF